MQTLSESELLTRDSKRDLNAELLESIAEMKATPPSLRKTEFIPQADGLVRRLVTLADGTIIHNELLTTTASARLQSGFSQARFAKLMGISIRTLQDWEQGRRSPSGAAKTLLRVAEKHPDILQQVANG